MELETELNCNILTPTLMAATVFLSRSSGLLNQQPGGPASLGHVPHSSIISPTGLISNWSIGTWGPPLLGADFLYRVLSLTDWTSCAPSYIIVHRPPSFCGRHKSHSFNSSTVKVISWYSSTEYPCYLHSAFPILTAWPGPICNSVSSWQFTCFFLRCGTKPNEWGV